MKTCIHCFTLSAAALLLAAGLVHLLNAAGHTQALALPDPLLGLPLRQGLLLAGTLESAVALICLFTKRPGLQLAWLAWMGTNLLVYRLGLIWSGYSVQCTCLGNPTDPLHLSRAAAAFILNTPPVYLVAGSCAALLWHWLHASKNPLIQQSSPAPPHHSAPASATLSTLNSPNYQLAATPPLHRSPAPFLKTVCFFCKGHIEFPTHAIGDKIHCPHCKMDITLKEPA